MTLAVISRSQGISLSYHEPLFARLRKKASVEGVRGPGGGYRLGKPANQISVANIIDAVDDAVDEVVQNHGREEAPERCVITHSLWIDFSSNLYIFLDGIKLSQFINKPKKSAFEAAPDSVSGHIATMFPPRRIA